MNVTKMNLVMNKDYSTKLVREYTKNYCREGDLQNPASIVKVMNDIFEMEKQAEEYLYLISMTTRCIPIGFFEVSHGTCDCALVGIREIFIRALLSGAAGIVLIHNHPGGSAEPSDKDKAVTRKIEKAAELIGLQFMDHIIIGKGNYYSFREEGQME